MKVTLNKDEALAKLKESLSTRLAQAMEAMTGAPQRCSLLADVNLAEEARLQGPLLGWRADYDAGPSVQLRIFASAENWRLIGKSVLEAAGVDEFDDPTLESTFVETIAQAGSAWAPDLSEIAGSKWESTTTGVGAEVGVDSVSWGYSLAVAEGEAKIFVQVSDELMAAVLLKATEAAPAASPAADVAAISPYDLLLDVELPVSVSFGRALVPLKEVLKLSSGSIVELNRAVTEPVEVIVNNCVIARGEVVVVEGNYGVRIQQIVSRQDRLRTVN
jgi:flagellar motor switch protein FliN/FliY